MAGPPFAVPRAQVASLFSPISYASHEIACRYALEQQLRASEQRGLTALEECVYVLRRTISARRENSPHPPMPLGKERGTGERRQSVSEDDGNCDGS